MLVDPKTLRQASFRGVPFYVEKESPDGMGRQVPVHEYVSGETHDTEDLGRKAGRFKITAYLAEAEGLALQSALIAACTAKGPGLLVLPVFGTRMVRCTDLSASHERQKVGYVGFEITFVDLGGQFAGFGGTPAGLQALALIGQIAGLFAAALAATPRTSPAQLAGAAVMTGGLVTTLGGVRTNMVLPAEAAAAALAATASLAALAPTITSASALGAAFAEWDGVAAAMAGDASEDQVIAAFSDGVSVLTAAAPTGLSAGRTARLSLSERVRTAGMAAMLGRCLTAACTMDISDRAAGRALLQRLTAMAEQVMDAVAAHFDEEGLVSAMQDALALTSRRIAEDIMDLAPLVMIEATRSYPASVAAWVLYGDPERGAELAQRNRVAVPLFMPRSFEALAP